MNRKRGLLICKHVVYALIVLLLYVMQTTPGLFAISGVTPMWVVPAVLTIAMREGEFIGGMYGAAAGLFIDTNSVTLFGYNGLFLCLSCVVAGLLVIYLLRANLLACLLFTALDMMVRGSISFLFSYGMWGHENVWKIYVNVVLPTVAYTVLVTPLVFALVRRVSRRFEALQQE